VLRSQKAQTELFWPRLAKERSSSSTTTTTTSTPTPTATPTTTTTTPTTTTTLTTTTTTTTPSTRTTAMAHTAWGRAGQRQYTEQKITFKACCDWGETFRTMVEHIRQYLFSS
jgi:hypothetical protein